MDLEGIMPTEISRQRKTNSTVICLHMEYIYIYKDQTQMVSKIAAGGQKIQTSNYKISKFWICNVQHRDYC